MFRSQFRNWIENVLATEDRHLSVVKLYIKFKYREMKNIKLGRELVGVDKYGNEYYQMYSHHGGLPTKRIVLYRLYDTHRFKVDVHFIGWLHKRKDRVPTPEELEILYLADEEFRRRGIQWDEQQARQLTQHQQLLLLDAHKYEERWGVEGGEKPKQLEWGMENVLSAEAEEKIEKAYYIGKYGANYIPKTHTPALDTKVDNKQFVVEYEPNPLVPSKAQRETDEKMYLEKIKKCYGYLYEPGYKISTPQLEEYRLGRRNLLAKTGDQAYDFRKYAKFREEFKDVFETIDPAFHDDYFEQFGSKNREMEVEDIVANI